MSNTFHGFFERIAGDRRMFKGSYCLFHSLSTPPAKDEQIKKRIAAEPGCAVYGDACRLPRGIKAGHDGPLLIGKHLPIRIGGNPTHDVMACGLDGDGLIHRIDAEIDLHKGGDLPELLLNRLLSKLGEVEMNIIFAGNS